MLIDLASPPQQWRALGDGFRVGVRIDVGAPGIVDPPPAAKHGIRVTARRS